MEYIHMYVCVEFLSIFRIHRALNMTIKCCRSTRCTLGTTTQGAFRATRFTSTPCCCCGFCSFREKQTRPSGQEFTLCQRTRSSPVVASHFGIPNRADGRRKGVVTTTSSATVQNPSKFYTQVTVASLRLSPQQMFTLSGVALVLDCLLCWAGT